MTSTQVTTHADQGQVDQAMQWLTRLLQLPLNELPEMVEIEAAVAALSNPASANWCMARVAALLSPYYDKDTPPAVRKMEAEDWLEALGEYPQWAIERAVRWWKSADNLDRRKRPLEGDIAARCKKEMRGIGSIPYILKSKLEPRYIPEPQCERKPVDRETAAAILKEAGFSPRRFGEAT